MNQMFTLVTSHMSADRLYLPPSGQVRLPSFNGSGQQRAWASAASESGSFPCSVR